MPKIKTVRGIENRKVVSQKEWLVARKKLLVKEKKFSKLRDELNLQRRKLPWVKIEKEYVFDGPNGKETLADLFCGKSQLIVYHFMFGPGWKEGCRALLVLGRPFRQREHPSLDNATRLSPSFPARRGRKLLRSKSAWAGSSSGFPRSRRISILISTCRSRRSKSRAECCLTTTASSK